MLAQVGQQVLFRFPSKNRCNHHEQSLPDDEGPEGDDAVDRVPGEKRQQDEDDEDRQNTRYRPDRVRKPEAEDRSCRGIRVFSVLNDSLGNPIRRTTACGDARRKQHAQRKNTISTHLEEQPGVKAVDITFSERGGTVVYDPEQTSAEEIANSEIFQGYYSAEIEKTEEYEENSE